jgi:uncharacterized protein
MREPSKSPIDRKLAAAVRAEARRFFRAARGSHDWDHTARVLRLCLHIGRAEGADLEVLTLAALLHDIGRSEEDRSNGKIRHADASARLAREILARLNVAAARIERILHCIEAHSYRKNLPPASLEARILFDADKLDSIGAVGIGRAFLFAGEVGARLHDKKVDIDKTAPYTKDDTAYREFLVKLRHIKERMFTAEGKRLAAGRHDFMVAYFDRLNTETDGDL